MLQLFIEAARTRPPPVPTQINLAFLQDGADGRQLFVYLHNAGRDKDRPEYVLPRVLLFVCKEDEVSIEHAALTYVKEEYPRVRWRLAFNVPEGESSKNNQGDDASVSSFQKDSKSEKKPEANLLVCVPMSSEVSLEDLKLGEKMSINEIAKQIHPRSPQRQYYSKSTRNQLKNLIYWIKAGTKRDPLFCDRLLRKPHQRIIVDCFHNPLAANVRCIRYRAQSAPRAPKRTFEEQEDYKLRLAAALDEISPRSRLYVNPLFNTTLQYPGRNENDEFFIDTEYKSKALVAEEKREMDEQLKKIVKQWKADPNSMPPPVAPIKQTSLPDFEMHAAAKRNDAEKIRDLFWAGHKANVPDSNGFYPIHYAAAAGALASIDALLNTAGANLQVQTSGGDTALHIAVKNLQPFAIELMANLKKGYEGMLHVHNNDGYTPIGICRERKQEARFSESLGGILHMMETLQQLTKIEIKFDDGGAQKIEAENGYDAKVSELLQKIPHVLLAPPDVSRLFSIWLKWKGGMIQLSDHDMPMRLAQALESELWQPVQIWAHRNYRLDKYVEAKIPLNKNALFILQHEIEHAMEHGWIKCSRDTALRLAALRARVNDSSDALLELLPVKLREKASKSGTERNNLLAELRNKIAQQSQFDDPLDRVRSYIDSVRKLDMYGCVPYACEIKYVVPHTDETFAFIAANTYGLFVYRKDYAVEKSYSWDLPIVFGIEKDHIDDDKFDIGHSGSADQQWSGRKRVISFEVIGMDYFACYISDPLMVIAIFESCTFFSNKSKGYYSNGNLPSR